MDLALVTAIYGGYDKLKPLMPNHGFKKAICVTDDPELSGENWEIVLKPAHSMHPRLAAKYPKFQPFDFVDADVCVWLDGSFEIKSDKFKDFCEYSIKDFDFVVWSHPDRRMRNCLYDEATLAQDWPKYRAYPIRQQTDAYRADEMPSNFGLWACGTILWKNNDNAKRFGKIWLEENIKWSIHDQISFPYLVWKHKPNFGEFEAHEYDNEFIEWFNHRDLN